MHFIVMVCAEQVLLQLNCNVVLYMLKYLLVYIIVITYFYYIKKYFYYIKF